MMKKLTALLSITLFTFTAISCSPVEQDSSLESLTQAPNTFDWRPSWSPDETRIAFSSQRDGNYEIYVINADGNNPVRLTDHADDDWRPKWSPDGKRIAFDSRRDGRRGIYVMNADGSNQTKLTNTQLSQFVTVARQSEIDTAIKRYREAKTRTPQERFFLDSEAEALAYEFLDKGNSVDALKLFTLNTEEYPNIDIVYVTLGNVYTQLKKKPEAIQAYEKALALNPDSATTISQLQQARID